MKDWLFSENDYSCDLRAAGVLIRNGRVLVQRDKGSDEYALPGGHVGIGEATADTLVREFFEEAGARIRCLKLLWLEECFYTWKDRNVHNITFYYLIELCENADIPDEDRFISHKDNDSVVFCWMPIEKLRQLTIYPTFVCEEIDQLDEGVKHFITRA